ncbi:MAG: hypothetical protein ABI867_27705 [Kofleriaceae bacterium]
MRIFLLALSVLFLVGTAATHSSAGGDAKSVVDAHARLAKQRALNLARLATYREAGVFTADAAGRPLSVFRDAAGRLCPMAYLIAASGRTDLVDHVARTNNTLQLADVTEGPLWDWMLASGLTREEIIHIQGIMRFGYDLEGVEQPRLMVRVNKSGNARDAAVPTGERMKRAVVRRLDTIGRELAIADAQSLAVATSRLPPIRR